MVETVTLGRATAMLPLAGGESHGSTNVSRVSREGWSWDGVTKRLWVEVEPEEDADREDDLDLIDVLIGVMY